MTEAKPDNGQSMPRRAGGASVPKETLDHLSEISRGGERTFAVILFMCAYSLLTIGNTTDGALVTNTAMSELPVVGIEVPVVAFYFVMPSILFGAYIYLQLYLLRLWWGMSALPVQDVERGRLDEYIRPWLIAVGFVRSRIPELRNPQAPSDRIESVVCIFLAWWLVPVTLFAFSVRYLPRHDLLGSSYHLLLLIVILLAALISFGQSSRVMKSINNVPAKPLLKAILSEFATFEFLASVLLVTAACSVVVFVILLIKGSVILANLEDTELSRKSVGWTGLCLDFECADLDAEVNSVGGAYLKGRDLRNAIAPRAFLVNATLEDADLRGADLVEAQLQGAKLPNARLQGANLTKVYLDHAELQDAYLDHASLGFANLAGTNGDSAHFVGASLAGAILDRSTLQGAKFETAFLMGATFRNAIVDDAQFQSATLSKTNFGSAYLRHANLTEAKLHAANLKYANAPDVVFRCANLSDAELDGAYMPRADFSGALLLKTNVRNAKLKDARFVGATVDNADFTGTILVGADLRGVDLTNVRGLGQDQLRNVCIDQDTKLPPGLTAGDCPITLESPPVESGCEG